MKRHLFLGAIAVALLLSACAQLQAGRGGRSSTLAAAGPTLTKTMDFEPFDPRMPDHIWMKLNEDRLVFLHFDRPVDQRGAKLLFVGDGIKGRFCAEEQPDGGRTGFVHFHSLRKPAGAEHAHGGDVAGEGFWLRHIAMGEFEMMGMGFKPGIAKNFMGTPPPPCLR